MNLDLNMTVFWYWWVLAAIFFAFELAAPGAFLLWLGFASTLSGFIFWAFPDLSLLQELLIFSFLSFISLGIWYKYFKGYVPSSTQPHLNDRASGLIGSIHTLPEAFHGSGKISINDSYWRIQGPDLKKGTKVKVIDVKGTTLIIDTLKK